MLGGAELFGEVVAGEVNVDVGAGRMGLAEAGSDLGRGPSGFGQGGGVGVAEHVRVEVVDPGGGADPFDELVGVGVGHRTTDGWA